MDNFNNLTDLIFLREKYKTSIKNAEIMKKIFLSIGCLSVLVIGGSIIGKSDIALLSGFATGLVSINSFNNIKLFEYVRKTMIDSIDMQLNNSKVEITNINSKENLRDIDTIKTYYKFIPNHYLEDESQQSITINENEVKINNRKLIKKKY